jgi:hypothetical protein
MGNCVVTSKLIKLEYDEDPQKSNLSFDLEEFFTKEDEAILNDPSPIEKRKSKKNDKSPGLANKSPGLK